MVRGRLGVFLVGVCALGGAACAGILGIDDRQLDTAGDGGSKLDGSGGSSGGSSGSSGSSSGGATDGGIVDSGSTCPDPCTMAMGLDHPFKMTADENNVYWTEFGDEANATNGSVKSCPVAGCASTGPKIYAQLQANPRGIAVDSTSVYWGAQGGIWTCPIAGCVAGKPSQVAGANVPFEVFVDATYVYWVDNFDDTVNRVLKGGGSDDMISRRRGDRRPKPGRELHRRLHVSSTFFPDYNYDVYRVSVGGGPLLPMFTQSDGWLGPAELALSGNFLYLGGQGSILQIPKTATTSTTPFTVVSGVSDPDGIQVDTDGILYWSDWGSGNGPDGTIGKVPTDGGAFTLLEQNQMTPEGIAVTSTYVFWTTNGTLDPSTGDTAVNTGALYRIHK